MATTYLSRRGPVIDITLMPTFYDKLLNLYQLFFNKQQDLIIQVSRVHMGPLIFELPFIKEYAMVHYLKFKR